MNESLDANAIAAMIVVFVPFLAIIGFFGYTTLEMLVKMHYVSRELKKTLAYWDRINSARAKNGYGRRM